MNLPEMQGMRFPSDTVIRMFYKEGLADQSHGKVLELGCGAGNHLMMFAAYGWQVTGLDYSAKSLAMAQHNLHTSGYQGLLLEHDLNHPLPAMEDQFDVLLAPSSLYYVSREQTYKRLTEVNDHLQSGALVYFRMRLPDDHRYGRGRAAGHGAWHLEVDYTGEGGLLNVFWTEHELIELLHVTLGIPAHALTILKMTYENRQDGLTIRNSDIVLWGRKP